jgi:hypothetical protein
VFSDECSLLSNDDSYVLASLSLIMLRQHKNRNKQHISYLAAIWIPSVTINNNIPPFPEMFFQRNLHTISLFILVTIYFLFNWSFVSSAFTVQYNRLHCIHVMN